MNETETSILTNLKADSDAMQSDLDKSPLKRNANPYSDRWAFANGFGVRLRYCEWAGLTWADDTVAKRYQRAMNRLANRGLVEKLAVERPDAISNLRRTHGKLTAAGLEALESIHVNEDGS